MQHSSVERSHASRTPKEGQAWKERAMRGLALWGSSLGEEITHEGKGVYSVPSCSGEGTYEVDLAVFGGEESCSCPDRERPCKHLIAATIHRAKRRAAARKAQAERTAARTSAANLAGLEATL